MTRPDLPEIQAMAKRNGFKPSGETSLDTQGLATEPANKRPDPDEKKKAPSVASQLVTLAEERYDLAVTPAGRSFAVPCSGPLICRMFRGDRTSLRAQLARDFRETTGLVAGAQALADAMTVLEGMAADLTPTELHTRVARAADGAIWLDVGDDTGQVIRIDEQGHSLADEPPDNIRFRRTALTAAMASPRAVGNLDALWELINVDEADQPLVLAWMVSTWLADVPTPVLGLVAEQGSGKSTTTRTIVDLVDPSPVPLRKAPKDPDAWVTAAAGSNVVALDNLSGLSDWLSDSLCRAVTGDGDVRRKLYTDGDLEVISFRRSLILNGIDLGAVRGDLADRMLPISLAKLDEANRADDAELHALAAAHRPPILVGLLDLTSQVMARTATINLEGRKPRMVDFAKVLAAVDLVLGTDGLNTFLGKQGQMAHEAIEDDPFIAALVAAGGYFSGTSKELLQAFTDINSTTPKGWPTQSRAVTTKLKRFAPSLRKAGWSVDDDGGKNIDHATRWTLVAPTTQSDLVE